MRITITAIARQCGVSHTLVSQALRGIGRMDANTRKRIVETATSLGYRANPAAQAIRLGRFGAVALVQDEARGLLSASLLEGLFEELDRLHLRLAFARLDQQALAAPGLSERLAVDGVMMNLGGPDPAEVLAPGATSIWINRAGEQDCVRPDDRGAMRLLTARLLAAGHRRIAYADWQRCHPVRHFSHDARVQGYQETMQAAGLEPRFFDLLPEERAAKDFFGAGRRLLGTGERPSAVLCYASSNQGIPLLAAALSLGLTVPRDLVFATVTERINTDQLPIACLLQPWQEVGRRAARMLAAKLARPEEPRPSEVVPYEVLHGAERIVPPAP